MLMLITVSTFVSMLMVDYVDVDADYSFNVCVDGWLC